MQFLRTLTATHNNVVKQSSHGTPPEKREIRGCCPSHQSVRRAAKHAARALESLNLSSGLNLFALLALSSGEPKATASEIYLLDAV